MLIMRIVSRDGVVSKLENNDETKSQAYECARAFDQLRINLRYTSKPLDVFACTVSWCFDEFTFSGKSSTVMQS